ncbi:MAG: hypothetical protein DCC75_14255, partial [Proteobacteria bacterium]
PGVQGDRRDRAAMPAVPKLAEMGTFEVPMKFDKGTVLIPFRPANDAETMPLEFETQSSFNLKAKSGAVFLKLWGSRSLPFCQRLAEQFGFTLTRDTFYRLDEVIRNKILDVYYQATWGQDTLNPPYPVDCWVDAKLAPA